MGYKILFTVNVLNEYYTDLFCRDFEILPSADTISRLTRHGLLWKAVGHKLIVLARTDAAGKPLIPIKPAVKFSFYLKLANPHFYNFTNLGYNPLEPKRYYFSNSNQSKVGTDLFVSSKIGAYSNTKIYEVGNFAANASGEVFEAIRGNKPGNVHALSDANFWIKRTKVPYVSSTDLLEVTPFVYVFNCIAATNFVVDVYGCNPAGGAYDLKVMDTRNLTFDKPQSLFPVRLDSLAPGKYRLKVNGEEKIVYMDGQLSYRAVFGLIEVFNYLPPASDFSLLDVAGKLKSPVFSLRFASRAVIWKYLARSSDVTAVKDTSSAITFVAEPGNQFVSKVPVLLREKAIKTLVLKSVLLGDVLPLPNPGTDRLGSIVKNGNTYLCSEVYLNY
ncbi:MAG TPA: hypothetical protein VKB19_15925 [Pedobacter sp.]|nr:hypothetical protein [Pedobacter sp.]